MLDSSARTDPLETWRFRKGNVESSVEVTTRLSINSGDAVRVAALQGAGIALLPEFLVREDIEAGHLQPLLESHEVRGDRGTALYAMHLPGRHRSPKVRVFIEFLKDLWP